VRERHCSRTYLQDVGSGVIYAALLVGWGMYFVPRWVRRHEELSEARSVERFSRAMRILSRRTPTPDQRYVVMPRREDHQPRARSRRVAPLAMRRRRILAGLVLTTLVVSVATPFTPLPWWAPVGMLLVTVADVVHLRIQARRQGDVTRTRASVRRRARLRLRRFDSVERIIASRQTLAQERAAALAARLAAEASAEASAREEAERLAVAAAGWQPVPVPLPTYVGKPKAPDRPAGRPLTEQQPFDQTEMAPLVEATAGDEMSEMDELDEIIERRRAVND
jgi:hypothetical protein